VEASSHGNNALLGASNPMQPVTIGTEVEGVFEHHSDSDAPYSLL
jgi:hypothetical protein